LFLTIHPTKPFSRNHLEIDSLVAVLSVHEMGEFHGIKLKVNVNTRHDKIQFFGFEHTFSGTTPLKSTKAVVILKHVSLEYEIGLRMTNI